MDPADTVTESQHIVEEPTSVVAEHEPVVTAVAVTL